MLCEKKRSMVLALVWLLRVQCWSSRGCRGIWSWPCSSWWLGSCQLRDPGSLFVLEYNPIIWDVIGRRWRWLVWTCLGFSLVSFDGCDWIAIKTVTPQWPCSLCDGCSRSLSRLASFRVYRPSDFHENPFLELDPYQYPACGPSPRGGPSFWSLGRVRQRGVWRPVSHRTLQFAVEWPFVWWNSQKELSL